jgi:hypothetical protein
LDCGDHRDGAVVHRRERGKATAVGPYEGVEAFRRLHLLDVDACVETPTGRPEDHDAHVGVAAEVG